MVFRSPPCSTAPATLAPDISWLIVHVVDSRPKEELERAITGLPGRGPGRHHAEERVHHATELHESQIREEIDRWLHDHATTAEVVWRNGRPEREIIALAQERRVDVIVLGRGRGRTGHHP